MARRATRKHIIVMMDLIILILFQVKAIDLAATPYHAFKLDIVQISFINCLVQQFETFQNNYKGMEHKRKYAENAFRSFEICAQKNGYLQTIQFIWLLKNCLESCINNRFTQLFRMEACFIQCYEDQAKRH